MAEPKLTAPQRALLEKVRAADGVTCLRGRTIATGQVLVKLGLLKEINGCAWQVVPANKPAWHDPRTVPLQGATPIYPKYCGCEGKETKRRTCGCGLGQCAKGLIL